MRPLQNFTNQALTIDEIGSGHASNEQLQVKTVLPQVISRERAAALDLSQDDQVASGFRVKQ